MNRPGLFLFGLSKDALREVMRGSVFGGVFYLQRAFPEPPRPAELGDLMRKRPELRLVLGGRE